MTKYRELLINRSHLRERDHPISSDVAEAIWRITGGDDPTLPVAITKLDVVRKLIDIAHEGEEGEADLVPLPAAKRAMTDAWFNRLSNTAVFQSGYKRYEANPDYGNYPVVPVTDYFFKIINGDGITGVLDAMSDHEIMNSLPKRRGRVLIEGDEEEFLRDDDGGIAKFGELAGILVFPANSHIKLLRTWLERRRNVAAGSIDSVVGALEHARPDAPAVEHLKQQVSGLGSTMTKALPRSKR